MLWHALEIAENKEDYNKFHKSFSKNLKLTNRATSLIRGKIAIRLHPFIRRKITFEKSDSSYRPYSREDS
jgi:hypothetical protein